MSELILIAFLAGVMTGALLFWLAYAMCLLIGPIRRR